MEVERKPQSQLRKVHILFVSSCESLVWYNSNVLVIYILVLYLVLASNNRVDYILR